MFAQKIQKLFSAFDCFFPTTQMGGGNVLRWHGIQQLATHSQVLVIFEILLIGNQDI